jgi:catechol 2,3-dioxygenase-like lactoylglutathione lyase family enzyme
MMQYLLISCLEPSEQIVRSQSMNARPKPFNGLRHLAIEVPKFEECLVFYTEILGMKILRRASDNLIYLGCGSDVLSLGRLQGEDPGVGGYVDHYGFVADTKQDLEDWFQFLKAQGVNVLDVPHHRSGGQRDPADLSPGHFGATLQYARSLGQSLC